MSQAVGATATGTGRVRTRAYRGGGRGALSPPSRLPPPLKLMGHTADRHESTGRWRVRRSSRLYTVATTAASAGEPQQHQPAVAAVPVIDMTALRDGSRDGAAKLDVARQLHRACIEVGFFHLTGHGVDPELLQDTIAEADNFFALPQAEKDKIWIGSSSSFRGYQRVQENVTNGRGDFHEAVDFYSESRQALREVSPASPSNYGKNQWPGQPERFRPLYESYITELRRVGVELMRGMAIGLGLEEDYFASYYDDSFWVLRAIHYPPPAAPGPEQQTETGSPSSDLGCGVHTDYGCLTLINADNTPGCLQARATSGEWMTVEPISGAFTCNIGDMLSRWTNGMYRSTPHRVLRPNSSGRTSIPFFFEPNYNAEIVPLPECCEASGSDVRFPPIVYGDHLLSKTSSNFVLS